MGRKPIARSAEEKRIQINASKKRHKDELRRAIAVAEYLCVTATEQHREASKFIQELEQKYPEKRDFRKTREFREWKQKHTETQTLLIQSETKATSSVLSETQSLLIQPETKATSSVPSESQLQEDLNTLDQIPTDVLDQLTAEIQADPTLNQLLDIGADIEFDDRLEHELNDIVHF